VLVEQTLQEYVFKVVTDLIQFLQVHQQLLQQVVEAVDHHTLVYQYQLHILDGQEETVVQEAVLVDIFHQLHQEPEE
tara:strand:- start:375 stop:605 length:231 start_codon:yes stop_codon:yes gene_type:complete